MIFKIDHTYLKTLADNVVSDLCCMIMSHGHFIDCNPKSYGEITRCISQNASKTQKDVFQMYKGFSCSGHLTPQLRQYLTTIDVDGTMAIGDLERLVSKESRVLVENGPYEWEVYKKMIGAYQRDPKFANMFELLVQAKDKHYITDLHGGGYGPYVSLIREQENGDYRNVFKYKACMVLDRDTKDALSFDPGKNSVFEILCNKKSDSITDDDVYTLQQPVYHWHMWYKREIENYFPNEMYNEAKVDTSGFPDDENERNYYKIESGTAPGYDKPILPKIAEKMGRKDYEKMVRKFNIKGVEVSEIELFLLKLVKII